MKKLGVILMSLLVMGCQTQYASNNREQYLNSKNGKNLVIPPPLSSALISHFYDLPQPPGNPIVSIKPPK